VLACQLLDGSWLITGSKGDRYRVTRDGMALTCDCPHGTRQGAGEAAAGMCWHLPLISAIEEALDEA
jgi:hypothetical protein